MLHEEPHPNGGNSRNVIGAAMVVGGGVAGMQAALDLANSGIKVYLVESSPAIGGRMAQLDKTFPTNDCAMCTISPKLVECGRHLNIEVLTTSELVGLEGEVGNFTAIVDHRPRHIDPLKCTACGECSRVCPIHVPSEYDAGLVTRNAAYRPYVQAVPSAFAIDKKGTAPCKTACPAGCSAQGYIALAAEGRYQEALDLVRETIPFPAVCGRVCIHPCEANCRRTQVDEPVAIMSIKRYLSDWERKNGPVAPPQVEQRAGDRVAVIGAGPAGLTAAQDLAELGYRVTIFEALPVAGGMMRVGIPASRLPKDVLQRDIDFILAKGVELKTGVRIGKDLQLADLQQQGFKATYLAVGAHISQKLGIPGEDLAGVLGGTDMLREVNLGQRQTVGERVAVIGGGDTAMDAARVSLRLGAKEVTIVYRRSDKEMPASAWEVEDTKHEGVKFQYLAAPVAVLGENGRVTGLQCVKMELGEPDASGRRAPRAVAGSEFVLAVDTVIPAVSQASQLDFLPEGVKVTKSGKIAVDQGSLVTATPGLFAGGDVIEGKATIVHAIAAGHKAAKAIDRYLRGEQDLAVAEPVRRPVTEPVEAGKYEKQRREEMSTIALADRRRSFAEVETGLTEEQLKAEAERCLKCGLCSECYACVKACKPQAIDHEEQPRTDRIQVGAVILAPGYDLVDAKAIQEFGFGRYSNVLSALQFERMLSASGPTGGHIQRPSDQVEPKRVAWLQCVGCRDRERKYCSSVCCMYATKEAVMAKEHVQGLDTHVFLMDMRAFGKGFDAYVDRAKNEVGVKYVRCRPSSVKENPANHNLIIRYQTEDGQLVDEEFDMVVLSTAIVPSAGGKRLADKLGVALNEFGFAKSNKFAPLETNLPGVFACGPFGEPMDIPDSVVQASGAAAKALQLLSASRGTLVQEKIYPPETVVQDDDSRVGVFVCHCGTNIAGVVDVETVRQHAASIPGVVHAERLMYSCSQDSIELIKQRVREHNLNRVVVASCTPRTHEPLFQDTIREAGLNEYLFEMANIRDQCSWVHAKEPAKATAKSKDLVRMAIARVKKLQALHKQSLGLTPKAVVLGGGVAGLTASLALSKQGFPVYLVEKEDELGGNLRRLRYTLDGEDPREFLDSLLRSVAADANIDVITGSTVVKSTGFVGNYHTTIADREGRQRLLEHGVTIVAIGAREYQGSEYLLGQNERVLTQQQLELRLADDATALEGVRNVVMVQCVGPGESVQWYCSRICCTTAVKNALKIKELSPSTNVFVLYKDMRTYGMREQYYTEARRQGVVFLRYVDERKPEVIATEGGLSIAARDEANNEGVALPADLLVLSTAVVPSEGADEVAPALKVPLSREGFFLEAHIKLRPVDFASEGIFLCGAAHYPKFIEESMTQALAAAARASTILSKSSLEVGGVVAHVNPDKCAACLTCVRVCPYHVPVISPDGVAVINEAECHGCGTCTSECPSRAITLMHYGDEQVEIKTDALLMGVA